MEIILLNIDETTDTLKRWIDSSVTREHLSLCREAVDQFITQRFQGQEGFYKCQSELFDLLIEKENLFGI